MPDDNKPSPFADLVSAIVWLALAAAIVVGAWRMDRLEHLQASVYSAPGLVPAFLGTALAIMALLLLLRALRAGALAGVNLPAFQPGENWRLIATLVFSLAFAIGLVGSGLPFWLATALYVAAFVFIFRRADGQSAGLLRGAVFAAVYGAISGLVVHYVFQDLFLVRLP